MSFEGSHQFLFVDVPDLNQTTVCANWEVSSTSGPIYTRYLVVLAQIVQFSHLWWRCIPNVDTIRESNDKIILLRPINKV